MVIVLHAWVSAGKIEVFKMCKEQLPERRTELYRIGTKAMIRRSELTKAADARNPAAVKKEPECLLSPGKSVSKQQAAAILRVDMATRVLVTGTSICGRNSYSCYWGQASGRKSHRGTLWGRCSVRLLDLDLQ